MWLSQLRLVNFRNFRGLRLEPQPGVLLFSGHNGQGKTNLLEGVYVLATTRSPRTGVERELLSWRPPEDADLAAVTPPFARLEARVRRGSGEIHLEVTFEGERPGGNGGGAVTRAIKVNGLATRAAGLVGQLPVVYFSPADVELAGGAPSGRRQYLNLANSQASPAHLRALQRYNRVLLQRNQVLRLVRERRQPSTALEPWTEQMLQWGGQILQQRLGMLRDIQPGLADIFRDLAGTTETLQVVYRASVCADGASESLAMDGLAEAFRERQAQLASREIDQAVSLVGPHRDDFTFVLDGVDLNTYGSRGQQRLAVLALKLAEADWMRSATGEIPVVLLDDVLSELDPQRRSYVLQRVAVPEPSQQRQVWITTTELDLSPSDEFLTSAQRYLIDAGTVRPGIIAGVNILGMGPMEILLIVVLALIVFGPAKLPEIMGQVGKAIGDFRRATSELSDEFNRTIQAELQETKAVVDDTKSAVTGVHTSINAALSSAPTTATTLPAPVLTAAPAAAVPTTNGSNGSNGSHVGEESRPALAETAEWSWETAAPAPAKPAVELAEPAASEPASPEPPAASPAPLPAERPLKSRKSSSRNDLLPPY